MVISVATAEERVGPSQKTISYVRLVLTLVYSSCPVQASLCSPANPEFLLKSSVLQLLPLLLYRTPQDTITFNLRMDRHRSGCARLALYRCQVFIEGCRNSKRWPQKVYSLRLHTLAIYSPRSAPTKSKTWAFEQPWLRTPGGPEQIALWHRMTLFCLRWGGKKDVRKVPHTFLWP